MSVFFTREDESVIDIGRSIVFPRLKLDNGLFSLAIPLSPSEIAILFPVDRSNVYISVRDETNSYTPPRVRFSAVPYAFRVPVDNQSLVFDARTANCARKDSWSAIHAADQSSFLPKLFIKRRSIRMAGDTTVCEQYGSQRKY